jgi:hypothetical protein
MGYPIMQKKATTKHIIVELNCKKLDVTVKPAELAVTPKLLAYTDTKSIGILTVLQKVHPIPMNIPITPTDIRI